MVPNPYVAIGFQTLVRRQFEEDFGFSAAPTTEQEILMERSRRALAEQRQKAPRPRGFAARLRWLAEALFPAPLAGSPYPES